MPTFERDDISLYYEIHGDGFPVLLFAPGGMLSAVSFWSSNAWDVIGELSPRFQIIAMDQRNAGASRAPVSGSHGWHTYAEDHLALLDHLNLEKAHVLGGCIGGPYCLGVIEAAPDRICSAVLQQTIGFDDNRALFYEMFDSWADDIKADHPEASEADWEQFRGNLFDGELDFNVGREFVSACSTPFLVLMDSDPFHPEITSREIADIAPNAVLVEQWKDPTEQDTVATVLEFLQSHTP